jgi:hypothetical protein
LHFVGFVLYNFKPKHEYEWLKIEIEKVNFVIRSFSYQSLRQNVHKKAEAVWNRRNEGYPTTHKD